VIELAARTADSSSYVADSMAYEIGLLEGLEADFFDSVADTSMQDIDRVSVSHWATGSFLWTVSQITAHDLRDLDLGRLTLRRHHSHSVTDSHG